MSTLVFTADGTLPHICSGNFSYEIKIKQSPYSYSRTCNIVENNIYQNITTSFSES